MQKSVKKITHEKDWDIETDHQCKVENVEQCRQVPEQVCNTVSKVGSTRVSKNVKLFKSALQRKLEHATL